MESTESKRCAGEGGDVMVYVVIRLDVAAKAGAGCC